MHHTESRLLRWDITSYLILNYESILCRYLRRDINHCFCWVVSVTEFCFVMCYSTTLRCYWNRWLIKYHVAVERSIVNDTGIFCFEILGYGIAFRSYRLFCLMSYFCVTIKRLDVTETGILDILSPGFAAWSASQAASDNYAEVETS